MATLLKQSTSVTFKLGPVVDKTDGVTLETGLATAMDNATTGIRVSKNGGAYADRNDATAPVYDAMGDYTIVLSSTDTNTLGTLKVIFEEAATCLPVWKEFMVVPANVYDSIVLGTDLLDINLAQWLGTAAAAPTVAGVPEVDITRLNGVQQSLLDLKDFADAGYDPATNKVQGVVLTDTVTTYTGNTPQTGDGYAIVNHVTYGNATLVRSTTPANTLDISAGGNAGLDFDNIENPTAPTTITNLTVPTVNEVAGAVGSVTGNIGGISGTIQTLDALDTAQDTQHSTTQTHLTDIKGATFSGATDSNEAIRNRGDAAWTTGAGGTPPQLLQSTTIATLATQISFTLTAGSADNDAYNGAVAIVTDSVTSTQKAVGSISDYVGSTLTVTLSSDPAIFTMAVGDTIDIIAAISNAPTAAAIRTEIDSNSTQLSSIIADTNELQADDVPGLIAALNDVAATDIVSAGAIATLAGAVVNVDLVDTTTTNTDMVTGFATEAKQDIIDTNVDSILVDTGTTIPATITTLTTNVATVDTVVDGIQTDLSNATDGLGALKALIDAANTDLSNGTDGLGALKALIDTANTAVAAIKVKSDQLVFTKANELDSNIQSINDVTVTGDGSATPFDV